MAGRKGTRYGKPARSLCNEPWRQWGVEYGMTMISAKDARQAAEKALKEKRSVNFNKEMAGVSARIREAMLQGHMAIGLDYLADDVISHLKGLGYEIARSSKSREDDGTYEIRWEKGE